MDIQGKIIFAAAPKSGTSARTSQPWKMQEFVIETHDTYPKKCFFSVFGEDKLQQFDLKVGDEVTVSVDFDAHEYNGRWYNDIRAWKVLHGTNTVEMPTAPDNNNGVIDSLGQEDASSQEGSLNDLPF